MENEVNLLEQSEEAKKKYDWNTAAEIYKKLAEMDSQLEKSANYYVKMGRAYLRASDISNSPREFESFNLHAIDAYNQAEQIFSRVKNIASSLEYKGEIERIKGHISKTHAMAKERFNSAYKIYSEAAENYVKSGDEEGYIRTICIKALVGFRASYRISNVSEFKRIYNEDLKNIQKIFDYTLETKNFEYIATYLLTFAFTCAEFTVINDLRDLDFKNGLSKIIFQYSKKLLDYIKYCEDNYSLSSLYFSIGQAFCFNGFHYTDTGYEQKIEVEKGLTLLKKAILCSKNSHSKSQYITSVFWYDWWALFGGFMELIQNRLLQDAKTLTEFGKIYENHYSLYKDFAYLLPSLMYNNLAQRSFFIVMYWFSVSHEKPVDYKKYLDISTEHFQDTLKLSREADRLDIYVEALFYKYFIAYSVQYFTAFKHDTQHVAKHEDIRLKFEDISKKIENCDDFRILTLYYLTVGDWYCNFGFYFVKDEKEQKEYGDKGLELLLKGYEHAKKINEKPWIIKI